MLNVLFIQESWRKGLVGLLLIVGSGVAAQPASIPQRTETIHVDSGVHSAPADLSDSEAQSVFRETVRIASAPWLRLLFDDYHLGEGSYITITSLNDGASQRLDAKSLAQWRGSTAYFNGDAVEVELYVASGDDKVFIRVDHVRAGDQRAEAQQKLDYADNLCAGEPTDRTRTNHLAVGRIVTDFDGSNWAGCTGWIASNGAFLSSGYCAQDTSLTGPFNVIEFNVPDSDPDRSINHPLPEDQYAIDPQSIVYEWLGVNSPDYAIFDVFPNSNTGLKPAEAQGEFLRSTKDFNPSELRVTGYYFDVGQDNRTQQEAPGSTIGHGEIDPEEWFWTYLADATIGGEGGPIMPETSPLVVGVHNWDYCRPIDNRNVGEGTSFRTTSLEGDLHDFPGSNVIYVDNGHPVSQENGGVLRPFDTVTGGVSAVVSGGLLSIVTGTYSETLTINKAMRIEAPVGTVTIDPTAAASVVGGADSLQNNIVGLAEDAPATFRLEQNQPNPVAGETQIEIALPEASHVSLAVYDILGREVARLIDGAMEPGVHTIRLDTSVLSSGVYVYRLHAGEFTQSRRMLVVK